MREIFAVVSGEAEGDLDLVISARPAAREATFEELREEFDRALRKLGARGN
jgi:RNase P protein component